MILPAKALFLVSAAFLIRFSGVLASSQSTNVSKTGLINESEKLHVHSAESMVEPPVDSPASHTGRFGPVLKTPEETEEFFPIRFSGAATSQDVNVLKTGPEKLSIQGSRAKPTIQPRSNRIKPSPVFKTPQETEVFFPIRFSDAATSQDANVLKPGPEKLSIQGSRAKPTVQSMSNRIKPRPKRPPIDSPVFKTLQETYEFFPIRFSDKATSQHNNVSKTTPETEPTVEPTIEPRSKRGVDEFFPDERDALMSIRDIVNSTVNLHKNWTGPPCLEDKSRWFGITCSKGHIIRIILQGINLTGSLPPSFLQNITFLNTLSFKNNSVSGPLPNLTTLIHLRFVFFSQNNFSSSIPLGYISLPNLTVLELQQNSLDGYIPPFAQPTLTTFNVSYNRLGGPIPDTPVLRRFPESSYDHNNDDLCGFPVGKVCPGDHNPPPPPPPPPPPNPSKGKNNRRLQIWIIGLIVSATILLLVIVMVGSWCCCRKSRRKEATTGQQTVVAADERRHRRRDPERMESLEFFDRDIIVFDLDDLLRASAEVIGKGNLGTTYKASLESGSVVVVKRFKDLKNLRKKTFVEQMKLLGKTRHENLVQIVSFYYSEEEKLVVYEFLPGGSLFQILHENRGGGARVALNWSRRLSIITDIAKGLAFLHQSSIPHANLKSSNVLLLQNHRAKLAGFGYSPLFPPGKLAVARSPEFGLGKKTTEKGDVYCFGIIVLEVITGKIPGEEEDLSDWVRMVVNNDWSTDILDLEIVGAREGHEGMLKLTGIALECTDTSPERRPEMTEVLRRIQEIEGMGVGVSLGQTP